MKKVVVIGGGIIGLSSAYFLHKAGHAVTVLDKEAFRDNCSYGNLGYICPSHFVPLAQPGMVWKGLKWMLSSRSPFYIQPSVDSSLLDWGLKFMRSATPKHVAASAVPLRDIALLSQHEYAHWANGGGMDFAFEQKGSLEVFQTSAVAHHAAALVNTANRIGLEVELLDKAQLAQIEPQEWNAIGAIYFKCDAHVYPDKLMAALLGYLQQQGVILQQGEATGFEKDNQRITKVKTTTGVLEADEVVVAAGAWSRSVAAMLDTAIALMPGRGYSFTLEDAPDTIQRPVILTEGRVAITHMDGNKMRYGGTMEIVRTTTPPRYHRVDGIVQAVKAFLPAFNISTPPQEKIWYGYRPTSADGLPYIGRTKKWRNVVVATGHSMLGLSLGAGTGKLVAELVDEQTPSIDLLPFRVERFG